MNTITQHGYTYPGVWFEGELVPEAHAHNLNILLQDYEDVDKMFPRAIAAPHPGDEDYMAEGNLLTRGLNLGMKTKWKQSQGVGGAIGAHPDETRVETLALGVSTMDVPV